MFTEFFWKADLLFLPGLLSPEAPASPQWPAVSAVSPSRSRGPGRGTLGCGTGGPGGEQMSPILASHAHLPSQGQIPQKESPAHTLLVHRTRSGAAPGVAGGHWEWVAPRAEGTMAGSSLACFSTLFLPSQKRARWEGARVPPALSPDVRPAVPKKLGASLPCSVSPKPV